MVKHSARKTSHLSSIYSIFEFAKHIMAYNVHLTKNDPCVYSATHVRQMIQRFIIENNGDMH